MRRRSAAPRVVAAVVGLVAAILTLGVGPAEAVGSRRVTPAPWTPRATAPCPAGLSLAFLGPTTGPDAALSRTELQGFTLAVREFDARNRGRCRVKPLTVNSAGDPAAAARRVADDASVVGVVGPPYSGESLVAIPVLDQAGVPVMAGGTAPALTTSGWKVVHRFLGNDALQGAAGARYLAERVAAPRVAVFDDGSAYGTAVAEIARTTLGSRVTVTGTVPDPAAVPAAVARLDGFTAQDAVYYAGYNQVAVPFVTQLRAAGIRSLFLAGDGVKDPTYLSAPAADGTYLTCLCLPVEDMPRGAAFARRFARLYPDVDPDAGYAPAAYDATNVLLDAIAHGKNTRAGVGAYVGSAKWRGVARVYQWDTNGDLADSVVYLDQVKDGALAPQRPLS